METQLIDTVRYIEYAIRCDYTFATFDGLNIGKFLRTLYKL